MEPIAPSTAKPTGHRRARLHLAGRMLLESSDEQVAEAAAAARATHVDSIRRAQSQTQATRRVWDNPVLWREICTWAYGRKILIVRIAYVALCAMVAIGLNNTVASIQAGDSFGGLDAFIPPVATIIANSGGKINDSRYPDTSSSVATSEAKT